MTDAGELHRTQPKYGKGPIDLVLDQSVSDGTVRQYNYMHWRYGKNKQNFEGRESIAEAMGISERTVTNRCAELEAAGYLVITRRTKGAVTRNFYDVFESKEDCAAWREENGRPYEPRKCKPRKTRVGVGGQPTHAKPEDNDLNSSSDGSDLTNVNSSSDTYVNSSSHSSPVTNVNSSSGDLDSVFNQPQMNQENPDSLKSSESGAEAPGGAPQAGESEQKIQPIEDITSKPARKRKQRRGDIVPKALMDPMKNAIAAALGWQWGGDEPMTSSESGQIQLAAQILCKANVKPEQIKALHEYCRTNYETFGPMALSTNVSKWRKTIHPAAPVVNPLAGAWQRADPTCPICHGQGTLIQANREVACTCLKMAEVPHAGR